MEILENIGVCTSYRFSCNEGEQEVGRVRLVVISNDLHDRPYGLVEDVFVEEEYRGKGYWKQLWESVLIVAKRKNCYKLIATSRFSREGVHAMYEKMGFEKYGFEFRVDL